MPLQEAEEELERIKAAQRNRGVIEPLVVRDELHEARRKFARALLVARTQPYPALGMHYLSLPQKFPTFPSFVEQILSSAAVQKSRIRWLDIGPGLPVHFMPYFELIDPERKLIDLHTLSPEQILPKKKRDPVGELPKRTINLPNRRSLQSRAQIDNPEYKKWKNRLTHHVGAIETCDPRKLGKFHAIVSIMGGIYHTRHFNEVVEKTAEMLERGGTAFIDFTGGERLGEAQAILGDRFKVEKHYFNNETLYCCATITRLK